MSSQSDAHAAAPAAAAPAEAEAEGSAELVSLYVKSKKIYARAVHGWFATWRWALVWATQLVFYGLPWLQWNDRQAVLFHLESRRFYIFNLVLYPQDFIYLTGLLIVSAYSLFLFTAVAGRLWCGYACPQTVYTEIFMWVEHKFQGDRSARMRLDDAGYSAGKFWRKAGTQFTWIAIALWTGFTFVGYFTPIRTLTQEALNLGFGPWEWFWILFYGFATYGNAGYMREQVCKYMCPYARFQSAMFDRDTLIISYDTERGEPRGARSRKADPKQLGLGSCVDCTLCVQVCPTGIDIRKGLQYECIGCAACIDVCDEVMDKMNYPRGLIRYATLNGMAGHLDRQQMLHRILRPRVLIYTAILIGILVAFFASIVLRSPFKVDVVRDRATLARMVDDGYIENVYRLQIMNATESPQRYVIRVPGLAQARITTPTEVAAEPTEAKWVPLAVRVPPEVAQSLGSGASKIRIEVERLPGPDAPEARTVVEQTTFLVPR